MLYCNQEKCGCPARFRFTWPGRDEAGICELHAPKLKAVAEAIGMHLQLIPIPIPMSDINDQVANCGFLYQG